MKHKRIILLLCIFFSVSLLHAQGKLDFNRIKAESHSFMTKEAGLSAQEAARFFPVFDEMKGKQRGYFDKLRAVYMQVHRQNVRHVRRLRRLTPMKYN